MAGETKAGAMSPMLPFGSCAYRERFSRQLLGFVLGRELIGLFKVNRWDAAFNLLLGCQFLIQHYLPIKFTYWQKNVNEKQRENKLKKTTDTKPNRNGNKKWQWDHSPWSTRKMVTQENLFIQAMCKRYLRRRIMGYQKKWQ